MCGLLGYYLKASNQGLVGDFEEALQKIAHRGPDDRDYKIINGDFPGQLFLGHNRLSILDLSSLGRQPMSMEDEKLTIVFNGEIYNFRELRKKLGSEGYKFNTNTDTEVLLKAFHRWGIDCLPKLIGMFAFCVYDKRDQKVTLVRDPFGIKPLFYCQETDRFIFASEIQSVIRLLAGKPGPDPYTAYHYLVHGEYDSSERTFFNNVNHLRPGTYISFDLKRQKLSEPTNWWSPEIRYEKNISFVRAAELVREQFLTNVKLHLVSDVPVGVALSGGIDSSSIVCAMRHLEPEAPIHTFSYIAEGTEKSEESWIDLINGHTNAIAHKVTATSQDLLSDLDDLIKAQGEPFGSTSIYAQYRVYKLAGQHGIKVMLDGQGADELLAGYLGYPGERLLSLLEEKKLLSALEFANNWANWPGRNYRRGWMYLGRTILPDGLYRSARMLSGRSFEPDWLDLDGFRDAGITPRENRHIRTKAGFGRRVVEQLAFSLQNRGLQHLLRQGDRSAMRFSIENRPAFLTTQLADLLYSLPENYLISVNGQTKHIFRQAMRRIVPDQGLDRKDKIGFETPEEYWKGAMIDEIKSSLEQAPQSFINKRVFEKKVKKFSSKQLWRILNYLKWEALYGNSCQS